MTYHYSLLDTFKIRFYLLNLTLPPELVSLVLNFAEIWIHKETTETRSANVSASWESTSTTMHYLVANQLPSLQRGGRKLPAKLRKVRFTIKSNDQGWSDFREHHETYIHSGSWFEAGLLIPTAEHPTYVPIPTGVRLPTSLIFASCFGPTGHEVENPLGRFPATILPDFPSGKPIEVLRWFLQANVHASAVVREHVVEWTHDDDTSTGDADEVPGKPKKQNDNKNVPMDASGAGDGKGFVDAFNKAGDGCMISLVVRAQTPGWENRVYEAKVETFFTFSAL